MGFSTASGLVNEIDSFRQTVIFRVGDFAIVHEIVRWRSNYMIVARSEPGADIEPHGLNDSLEELLCSVSPEFLAYLRDGVVQSMRGCHESEVGPEVARLAQLDKLAVDSELYRDYAPVPWGEIPAEWFARREREGVIVSGKHFPAPASPRCPECGYPESRGHRPDCAFS